MGKLLKKKASSIELFVNCTEDKWSCPREYVNIVFYWLIRPRIWILHNLEPFPIVNIVFYWLINTVAGFDSWNSFKDGFACWKNVIFLSCFVDLFVQYGWSIPRLSKYHFRIVITNSWPMNDDGFKHCQPMKTLQSALSCFYGPTVLKYSIIHG